MFFFSVGLCRTSSPWTRSPFFSPPKCIDLISCRLMQDGGTLVKTLCRPTLRHHKATWRVGKSEGEPRTRHGEVNKQGVRQPEDKAGCTIISTRIIIIFLIQICIYSHHAGGPRSLWPLPLPATEPPQPPDLFGILSAVALEPSAVQCDAPDLCCHL